MTILLFLVAIIAPSIAEYNDYSSCPFTTLSDPCGNNYDDLYETRYVNVVENNGKNKYLDNVCYTFFPLENKCHTYLAYLTAAYNNGSTKTLSFIVHSNSTNIFYFTSPYCSFEQATLSNNNGVEVVARRIISGACADILHPVIVSYPCLQYGSTNDLAQIRRVLANNGFGCVNLLVLPRNLPTKCVNTQTSSSVGSTANCPGQCYGAPSPNYPPYSYNPPTSSCGCSK